MRKLLQFNKFDMQAFSQGKVYLVTGISPWNDFTTKAHLGTKVEVVIAEDKTPYKSNDGEVVSNAYEKLQFKVAKDNVSVPVGAQVVPVNPVATIWGDYHNKLSVKCDDVKVVQKQA
ncbi:hypothetical protein [Paratractidigestivibacter sp.]|uniref:hypothetical protein n=1 Tax=Paratractidigestivibacter sp. TaxID=2847316 RepID=UPI002ACB07C6|nr:hypothetical protein [Paratractidigestivibacter sp.]